MLISRFHISLRQLLSIAPSNSAACRDDGKDAADVTRLRYRAGRHYADFTLTLPAPAPYALSLLRRNISIRHFRYALTLRHYATRRCLPLRRLCCAMPLFMLIERAFDACPPTPSLITT